MDECFRCNNDSSRTLLFDVISNEGIKKICKKCLSEENLPVVRKPSISELDNQETEKKGTYERLSRVAGIDPIKHSQRNDINTKKIHEQEELRRITNQKVMEKSSHSKIPSGFKPYFHWALMRQRRLKKITQRELAEKIREPEEAIKMFEKGIVPEDYISLTRKVERALGIELFEKEFRKNLDLRLPEFIDFEKKDFDNLTIADLKKIKESKFNQDLEENEFDKDEELFEEDSYLDEEIEKKGRITKFLERIKGITKDQKENSEKSEEIFQDDIDKIIYRK